MEKFKSALECLYTAWIIVVHTLLSLWVKTTLTQLRVSIGHSSGRNSGYTPLVISFPGFLMVSSTLFLSHTPELLRARKQFQLHHTFRGMSSCFRSFNLHSAGLRCIALILHAPGNVRKPGLSERETFFFIYIYLLVRCTYYWWLLQGTYLGLFGATECFRSCSCFGESMFNIVSCFDKFWVRKVSVSVDILFDYTKVL